MRGVYELESFISSIVSKIESRGNGHLYFRYSSVESLESLLKSLRTSLLHFSEDQVSYIDTFSVLNQEFDSWENNITEAYRTLENYISAHIAKGIKVLVISEPLVGILEQDVIIKLFELMSVFSRKHSVTVIQYGAYSVRGSIYDYAQDIYLVSPSEVSVLKSRWGGYSVLESKPSSRSTLLEEVLAKNTSDDTIRVEPPVEESTQLMDLFGSPEKYNEGVQTLVNQKYGKPPGRRTQYSSRTVIIPDKDIVADVDVRFILKDALEKKQSVLIIGRNNSGKSELLKRFIDVALNDLKLTVGSGAARSFDIAVNKPDEPTDLTQVVWFLDSFTEEAREEFDDLVENKGVQVLAFEGTFYGLNAQARNLHLALMQAHSEHNIPVALTLIGSPYDDEYEEAVLAADCVLFTEATDSGIRVKVIKS
jgi:hypothetical protein